MVYQYKDQRQMVHQKPVGLWDIELFEFDMLKIK